MSTSDGKALALTFDDGPDERFTARIAQILAHYGVRATFFCLGARADANRGLVGDLAAAGHAVGNHTWDHPHLTELSAAGVTEQIVRTADLLQGVTGVRPRLFRPPYGDVDERVAHEVNRLEHCMVLWDVDSRDWSGIAGPQVAANVLSKVRPGANILLHSGPGAPGTPDALPYIVEVALASGYRFVTLDQTAE